MDDPTTIWTLLGIKLTNLTGGTAGGIAAAIIFNKSGVFSILGTVTLGALTSAYMSDWCSQYFGNFGGGISFVVGLCAMAICQQIMSVAKKWSFQNSKDVSDVNRPSS